MTYKICKNYTSNKKLVKLNQYKIMFSYTSIIEDLNKGKLESLSNHFHTIEKAIKFAKRQIVQGIPERGHVPLPELADSYRHRVFCAAKRIYENEKKKDIANLLKKSDEYLSSEPFWIDWNNIVKYDIREDKSLDSKFQVFVEFKHANKNEQPLKLNARMSKQAYKHKDEIYKDGFDLVRYSKNLFGIRHSKQILVEKVKNENDLLLHIDKYANIFKTYTEQSEGIAFGHSIKDSTNKLSKLVKSVNGKLSKKAYKDKLHRIKMQIKQQVKNVIDENCLYNVTVLKPIYCKSKFANDLTEIYVNEVKMACKLNGIQCKVYERADVAIDRDVKSFKKNIKKDNWKMAKDWKDGKFNCSMFNSHLNKLRTRFSEHTRWSDYSLALMKYMYGNKSYMLVPDRSIINGINETSQQDDEAKSEYLDYEDDYDIDYSPQEIVFA